MTRILIVEDNLTTANYLNQGFKENFFIPEIANDGQEGWYLTTCNEYGAIILDVMLPHIDGWEFIRKLRQINKDTPVLFLTAKDEVSDRVKGLELGADDYLIKPFAFSELLARVRSLLRRRQPHLEHALELADLKIDVQKHKVTRSNQLISLTAKEFMLLLLFVRRRGEVLSRTYIAEQVWDIHFDTDTNAIDVAIKRMRDKIDKDFSPKLIHSVRGVGYVMEAR
jgi:two-component system copper resistance phosphate regulon response regulator CusR